MTTQQSQDLVSVIGPEFISPDARDIIVKIYPIGNLVITDTSHKILINVKPCTSTFYRQRVLLYPDDKPIVILRRKNMTLHCGWNAFRGESDADSDMIFTAKKESMIQFKTSVKVTLANNSKDDFDLMFKGSWSKRNCTLYIGDSSTPIARMHPLEPSENMKYCDKDKFMVTINPNVDYAFVVAIIAIVEAMKKPDEIPAVSGVKATTKVIQSILSLGTL